ncbi:hypothetical protein HMPREF9073_01335 [Capnocytophaga sp. oral taxon 326 str. F0382]|nr:hypothetical protein HMPREF9073_01335 [Capnocytophaga sp. oral taxon 326 str. F0382]
MALQKASKSHLRRYTFPNSLDFDKVLKNLIINYFWVCCVRAFCKRPRK